MSNSNWNDPRLEVYGLIVSLSRYAGLHATALIIKQSYEDNKWLYAAYFVPSTIPVGPQEQHETLLAALQALNDWREYGK